MNNKLKKAAAVVGILAMVGTMAGCGAKAQQAEQKPAETQPQQEQVADKGQDFVEVVAEKYTFRYDPQYFAGEEGEGDSYLVTFANEDVNAVGDNLIHVSVLTEQNAKEYMEGFLAEGESLNDPSNFGAEAIAAYAYIMPLEVEDKSEVGTMTRTVYAMQNDKDTVLVEVVSSTPKESNEEVEYLISDKIAEVLDTFALK